MKKKIILCATLHIIALIMSSCSYKEIDEKIQQNLNGDSIKTIDFNTEEINDVTVAPPDEENIKIVKVNDKVPDYFEYFIPELNETVSEGRKGVEYVLNNVTVYDSVFDSGINLSECTTYDDLDVFENNAFIIADMTARYDTEDFNEQDEIMLNMAFSAWYRWNDGYTSFEANFPYDVNPNIVYFSEHPIDGDKNIYGDKLSPINDYFVFRNSFKNGDMVDFKLGIIVSKSLVESKNVFMILRYSEPPADDVSIFYIDLLGW